MIVYKRKLTSEDIANLNDDEELIYYKNENIAITVNHIDDIYVVREKQISNNEKIEEYILKTADEIMKFA